MRPITPPLVFGFRRGALRYFAWLLSLLVACAMVLFADRAGLLIGLLVLGLHAYHSPPRYAALVYFLKSATAAEISEATPCLWLDTQRVVLGAPYRVIYRDEVQPAEFARLRRLCRGLPA